MKSLPALASIDASMELVRCGLESYRVQGETSPKGITHDHDSEDHESVMKTNPNIDCRTFFSLMSFFQWVFSCKVFIEAIGAT